MNIDPSRYKVGDAMTMNVIGVERHTNLLDCAKLMQRAKIGSLIIMDSHKQPLGIMTEKDMVRKGMIDDQKPSYLKAEDVMVTKLITVSPEEPVLDALRLMRDHDIKHLPVVHQEKLVGFVTAKDLLSIQPDLFELWMEHFTIKEAERKPLWKAAEE